MATQSFYAVVAICMANPVLSGTVVNSTLFTEEATVSTFPQRPNPGIKCEFFLADPNLREDVNDLLQEGAKLIKFNVRFKDYPKDILISKGGDLFRPTSWMRSTSAEGESLLVLDDNFEVLSLSLLGIGVSSMSVELDERPFGCMNELTWEERENKTRELLINDFKPPNLGKKGGKLVQKERICNMRVKSSSGVARFVHHCCHLDLENILMCEDIERGLWINILLLCIIVIKILVVLNSPSFIPETFYREKFTATRYVHRIPAGQQKMVLKVVKTTRPKSFKSPNPPIRREMLEDLECFTASLNVMEAEKKYSLTLDKIALSAKCPKLLPENYVPVSIMKLIYENVFRCKMRSVSVLKPCCDSPVCGVINVGCKVMRWYKCLRILTKMVLVGILAIPWIIRLVIYFTYEAVTMEEKRIAAEKHGLSLNFSGSLTLYLTPFHGWFLATYIIVTIDSLAYGLLGKGMKQKFKFILRKCLRDMRERSRLDTYGWAIGLLLVPFKKLGLLGIFLAPLFWIFLLPGIIPVLAFYTFPALNLSVRLVIHLFIFMCPSSMVRRLNKISGHMNTMKHNLKLQQIGKEQFQSKENMSLKEVFLQLAIIVMCLTSFWSVSFLLMECLSFFVEIGVYTLMGIIVNAGATLQYITLLFLIWMYANSSFGAVHKIYLAYHKVIRGELLARKKNEIHTTARQDESVQESVVFRVQGTHSERESSSMISIEVKDGMMKWKTRGLLVFLNKVDQPFTPAKFFFETIDMNYCGCPGKLWHNTLLAFYNFMKIMVFLMFVVIVVLAFGNQFSTTNQMLATLAGGFVPFVFSNFFKKESQCFTVDTESVQFVTEFDNAIENYTQKWPVEDIVPVSIRESGEETADGEETIHESTDISEKDKVSEDGRINEHIHISETDKVSEDGRINEHIHISETDKDKINKESQEVKINVEDNDSENDMVDLIIDCSRFDKHQLSIGTDFPDTAGSVSMLEDNVHRTSPSHRKILHV